MKNLRKNPRPGDRVFMPPFAETDESKWPMVSKVFLDIGPKGFFLVRIERIKRAVWIKWDDTPGEKPYLVFHSLVSDG